MKGKSEDNVYHVINNNIIETTEKRQGSHLLSEGLTGILSVAPPILKFIVDLTVWAP